MERLEIVVSRYEPATVLATSRPASYSPGALGSRPLVAGETSDRPRFGTLTRVGSFYDETIDPAGYPGGEAKRYNFKQEPFETLRTLAPSRSWASRPYEARSWEASGRSRRLPQAQLRVGLNDTDPGNNRGHADVRGFDPSADRSGMARSVPLRQSLAANPRSRARRLRTDQILVLSQVSACSVKPVEVMSSARRRRAQVVVLARVDTHEADLNYRGEQSSARSGWTAGTPPVAE